MKKLLFLALLSSVTAMAEEYKCTFNYSYFSDETRHWIDVTDKYARLNHGQNGREDYCTLSKVTKKGDIVTYEKAGEGYGPCELYARPLKFDRRSLTAKIGYRVNGPRGYSEINDYDLTCARVK